MYFNSWQDYQAFARQVRFKRRYIFDDKIDHFLNVVSQTSERRRKYIKEGTYLWRAQKGSIMEPFKTNTNEEIDFKCPYPCERMKSKSKRHSIFIFVGLQEYSHV